METSTSVKSYLILSVILTLFFVFTSQVDSAALITKRSIARRDNDESVCRSNAVCGWEVYDSYTRNLEYYVSSSCKCSTDETCIRMDDDVSISAYVYRCRPRRNKNKTRTTNRPENQTNTTF